MLDILGGIVSIILVVGFFGGLLYATLFRARDWNYPLAARGIGVMLLAGIVKVVLIALADNVSDVFGADYFNYALGAVAAAGMLMMMAGFGGGTK